MNLSEGLDSNPAIGGPSRPGIDAGPLDHLPSLSRRQVRMEERLGPSGPSTGPALLLSRVSELLVAGASVDRFEVIWRASGGLPSVSLLPRCQELRVAVPMSTANSETVDGHRPAAREYQRAAGSAGMLRSSRYPRLDSPRKSRNL